MKRKKSTRGKMYTRLKKVLIFREECINGIHGINKRGEVIICTRQYGLLHFVFLGDVKDPVKIVVLALCLVISVTMHLYLVYVKSCLTVALPASENLDANTNTSNHHHQLVVH